MSFSFESQFKGAIRERYEHEALALHRILLVTDMVPERAARVMETARTFLAGVKAVAHAQWELVHGAELGSVPELIERVEAGGADLIITYRNLREQPRSPGSSLGNYLDSLTQATKVPVLVLPVRKSGDPDGLLLRARLENTDRVVVITDHLAEDPALVRYGAEFTQAGGILFLTHIEDKGVFERYMKVISHLPEIDDELARERIGERLLLEARRFCDSAAVELHEQQRDVTVKPIVEMGEPVSAYRALLASHEVDLVVADAKDPGHSAMSALAYSLTVELLDTPILLL